MRTNVLSGRARGGRLILVAVTLFVHVAAVVCLAGPPFRPPRVGGGFPPSVSNNRPQGFALPFQARAQAPSFRNNSFQGVQVSPRQNFQPFGARPNPVFTPNPNRFAFQNQPLRRPNPVFTPNPNRFAFQNQPFRSNIPPPSRPNPAVTFNVQSVVRPQALNPSPPSLQPQQGTRLFQRPPAVKPTVMGWPNPVQQVQSVSMNNPVQRPGVSPAIGTTGLNTPVHVPPRVKEAGTGAVYVSPKHTFIGNGTLHKTANASPIKPVNVASSTGTSAQHPLRQGLTQPGQVNHLTGIDHQLANAKRKSQESEKAKRVNTASGGGLRPGSTSVATHNPKVNLGDRPHVSVSPHKAPSNKDGLSQKPVAYSGWSHQSVTNVSNTNSSHQTGSKLPTTHGGTSATHTTSNVPPVKKNKIVDGHSDKIVTGPKHLGTGHSPQHNDLQNEATILNHKYPPSSSKNIDQHLASVKAHTWGSNSKKTSDKSMVSANMVNRVNVSTSAKDWSKTTTPTKSGSKVTSTKPIVNPQPTTTLAKTGTATTAPIKGSLSSTLHKVYRDSLMGDIESGAQSTFAPVENTVTSVGGALTKGAGTVSSYVTGGITKVGNTLSPSSSPIPFVGVTPQQPLTPFHSGTLLPPKINPSHPIPSSSGTLLPPKINPPTLKPPSIGSGSNVTNISNSLGSLNPFVNFFGNFPIPTPEPTIPPSPPYLLPHPYPTTTLPTDAPTSIPTPGPGPEPTPTTTPSPGSTGDSDNGDTPSPGSTGDSDNGDNGPSGGDCGEPGGEPVSVTGTAGPTFLTYDSTTPTTSVMPPAILPDSTSSGAGPVQPAFGDTAPAQSGFRVLTNPTGASQPANAGSANNTYVFRNPGSYNGMVIGDGGDVNLVQQCAGAPLLSQWKSGAPVRGNDIAPGTAIATFDGNGNYQDASAGGHAAIYDSQDQHGIWVWDQRAGQPVQRRYIRFKNGVGSPGNDGDAYSVISQ